MMRKFYDAMKKKGKRPCRAKIPGELGKFVETKKAFGLASIATKGDAEKVYVIQPFRFFETKRELSRFGARGDWAKEGGTGTGLPMKDADLLSFYFILKRAAERGVKTLYVSHRVSPMRKQPYEHIYDRLIRIAPEKGMDSGGGGYGQKYGIFTRRQGGR